MAYIVLGVLRGAENLLFMPTSKMAEMAQNWETQDPYTH